MRRIIVVAAVLTSLALPSLAEAQRGYVGIGLGPAIRLDDWPTQLRVEQEIGVYVSGRPTGFFIAFAPSQSWFGNRDWWILVFPVRLGGMFDLFRNRDLTFQLGVGGTLGFAVTDQFNNRFDPEVWFHFSFGPTLRLLLANERLAVYVRPVDLEFGITDSPRFGNEGVRYILAGGIQYYF